MRRDATDSCQRTHITKGSVMKKSRRIKPYQNKRLAESAIIKGRLVIRGTREWEDREVKRANEGCKVLSWNHNE